MDANYRFLYVNVGSNGRVNDAAVFRDSSLYKGIEDNLFDLPDAQNLPNSSVKAPYVFVADEAFRLSSRILKPNGQRSITENKIFNYRLSRARRVVENAFGILVNRFRVLESEINLSVEKVEQVTLTCCVLHNFIKAEDGTDCATKDFGNISNIAERHGDLLLPLQKAIGNRSTDKAIEVRDIYTKYFNNEGSVPWQLESINKFNF